MEIITGIFDDKEQMEKDINYMLNQGWKIITSNIAFETTYKLIGTIGNNRVAPISKLWYYVMMQKK